MKIYQLELDIESTKRNIAYEKQALSSGMRKDPDNLNVYLDKLKTQEYEKKTYQENLNKQEYGERYPEQQWTWNLTPKLKKAAKDGLPYYVALPPIYAGTKAARDDEYEQNLSSRAAGRAAYVQ